MSKLRAIFFDFDGLMLDTEYACFAGWQAVFQSHGFEYRLEEFQRIIGTDENPRALLEERVGCSLDWEKIEPERREVETKFGLDMAIKPGVMELVHDARTRGWICAVVSSSPHYWIRGHLERCEVIEHFDGFICRGDAPKAKPAPDLYLEALRQFNLTGSETVALEDSHNGSLAAKRAGIWCVAVPNDITRSMDFSHSDLITEKLEELTLDSLVQRFG
ncbi:MAG: HAD-IA family hydrolase [Verrucomicrobia bacterium]|nr:HAD-IA family hydrolase [Verrucomicrobiota bacterium]MDA1066909.1 HAD-IA family hydrolase [Verrucomicrobiota bacterium]